MMQVGSERDPVSEYLKSFLSPIDNLTWIPIKIVLLKSGNRYDEAKLLQFLSSFDHGYRGYKIVNGRQLASVVTQINFDPSTRYLVFFRSEDPFNS